MIYPRLVPCLNCRRQFVKQPEDSNTVCPACESARTATSPQLRFDGNFTKTPEAQQAHAALKFAELKRWAQWKRKLKRGPRMTRKQRAAFLLEEARRAGLSVASENASADNVPSIPSIDRGAVESADNATLWELLTALYNNQTPDERASAETIHLNHRGFSASDARFLSHVVEVGQRNSPPRIDRVYAREARERLAKYAKQLEAIFAAEEISA